jgi:hypothetical protein
MLQRCNNKNDARYPRYGGRGITVCKQWHSFKNFINDMGRRPSPDLQLDRINNDAEYAPWNCRWATRSQQQNNQRRSLGDIAYGVRGEFLTVSEIADRYGISHHTLKSWRATGAVERMVEKRLSKKEAGNDRTCKSERAG